MIDIKVNKSDMRRLKHVLGEYSRQIPNVLRRAINKTSDSARVQAVREIAADTKLKQKDLFGRGNGRRPIVQTRANNLKLESTIRTTNRRIPLSRFKARQTKKGVSYDLGRGRTIIPGAFMTALKTGHVGVFARAGTGRLPITEKFGPSIGHVFVGAAGIIDRAVRLANRKLPENINTQLNLVLERNALKKSG